MIGYVPILRLNNAPRIGITLDCYRYVYVELSTKFKQRKLKCTDIYKVEFEPKGGLRIAEDGKSYLATDITFLELV